MKTDDSSVTIADHIKNINSMSHEEMAYLYRHAPPGHPYFSKEFPLYEVFEKRFASFGGMTSEMSKKIGW